MTANHEQAVVEGDWLLVEIDGEPIDIDAPRSVRFESDRVTGQVGVNRFTGSFTIDGNVLEIGPAASTRMAGPPELMDLEHRFLSQLQGEHEIDFTGTELTLGEKAIVMSRAPAFSVKGTVSYRERMMLPPDSVVMVELVDISAADVAVEPLATQLIADANGPPIPFSLDVAEDIDERRRLAVKGRIVSAEGDLLWATDTAMGLQDRAQAVDLWLRRSS